MVAAGASVAEKGCAGTPVPLAVGELNVAVCGRMPYDQFPPDPASVA
jgi:hypothetical protein